MGRSLPLLSPGRGRTTGTVTLKSSRDYMGYRQSPCERIESNVVKLKKNNLYVLFLFFFSKVENLFFF